MTYSCDLASIGAIGEISGCPLGAQNLLHHLLSNWSYFVRRTSSLKSTLYFCRAQHDPIVVQPIREILPLFSVISEISGYPLGTQNLLYLTPVQQKIKQPAQQYSSKTHQ